MLSSLKIENIAVIESAEIDFRDGLCVLSGETGAGKSIIIDSISAVLGERTSKELIRTGQQTARVTAAFESIPQAVIDILDELDIPVETSLIISRVISIDGRNTCKVNGTPTTVSNLKRIGRELISIHGQHDSQTLLNPESHYLFLDALGDNKNIYEDYITKYNSYTELYRRFKTLSSNEEEKNKRIEFLKFEIDEIKSANLRVGENDELLSKREMYRNSEKIVANLQEALSILSDSDDASGALTNLFSAQRAINKSAEHFEDLKELADEFSDLAYAIKDKKDQIENALFDCEFDAEKQAEVEERLNLIFKLKTKYGETEEDILDYLKREEDELNALLTMSQDKGEILEQLEHDKNILLDAAETLSLARKHTASEFEVRVKNELEFLDMPYVALSTEFTPCKLSKTGSDIIEFLISPNKGEALKPLAKIASGGELARIMLAIQKVLSRASNVGTMIFDEIDTGVSGSAAEKIALTMSSVAKERQVICITHSSQVAAYADSHYKISKSVHDEKTYTEVELLDKAGRVNEIARIIGGVNITDLQRVSAEEMIENASTKKGQAK